MSGPQNYRQLSLPTGTETLQLQEAARHRRITRSLEDLFSLWGYDPVETALVDYFEVYRRLVSEEDVGQMYRAVDRQGEILALRSDTTLFLAKQLGLHLREDELPVRVYYNDQIIRAQDRNDISNNEYQQAGIELVGVEGPDGDAEVLLLAMEALDTLGLQEAFVHLGSHAVVEECARTAGVATATLEEMVRRRAFAEIADTSSLAPRLIDLLGFIGPAETFADRVTALEDEPLPQQLSAALSRLTATATLLSDLAGETGSERIRIDLSELGASHYYTGIAFSAYAATSNAAILRGGRYDALLKAFGFDAPSVGFSLFTRKLPEEVMAATDSEGVTIATGGDFAARVRNARRMRSDGTRVRL
jgi:ATP phosphoribosyltransferase regulatory subunit